MTVPLLIKEESSQASGLQDLQLDLKLFSLHIVPLSLLHIVMVQMD